MKLKSHVLLKLTLGASIAGSGGACQKTAKRVGTPDEAPASSLPDSQSNKKLLPQDPPATHEDLATTIDDVAEELESLPPAPPATREKPATTQVAEEREEFDCPFCGMG